MLPHQEQVVTEANELSIKLLALEKFIYGEFFKSLPADEQERLRRQLTLMEQYHTVLSERIAKFPQED